VVGPRIVAAGPKLDGEGLPVASSRVVRTSADARNTVDDLAAAGVDFIKVHGGLDRARLLAIAAESRARGLRFAGHVPDDVTPSDAARMGIHSIEHFSGFSRPCSDELKRLLQPSHWKSARTKCAPDSDLDATFAVLRSAGTWVTPTLVSYRGLAEVIDPQGLVDPRWRYVPPALRASWDKSGRAIVADIRPARQDAAVWRSVLKTYGLLTAQARRDHVLLLSGTDLGNPLVSPGFDLQDELLLLVQAGLTPSEALFSATVGPANFLNKSPQFGSVAKGEYADLVLLDADPLKDIRNVQRIRAVIANGRLLDRKALDELLARANPVPRSP
jgi:imidazolonepropionase-like amidohydrolase